MEKGDILSSSLQGEKKTRLLANTDKGRLVTLEQDTVADDSVERVDHHRRTVHQRWSMHSSAPSGYQPTGQMPEANIK